MEEVKNLKPNKHNKVIGENPMSKDELKDLTDEELEYYSRQIVLPEIGYNGQLKLRDAKVCIVGLGGLGSPAAMQLAAMGVGHLRLVDRDVVVRLEAKAVFEGGRGSDGHGLVLEMEVSKR